MYSLTTWEMDAAESLLGFTFSRMAVRPGKSVRTFGKPCKASCTPAFKPRMFHRWPSGAAKPPLADTVNVCAAAGSGEGQEGCREQVPAHRQPPKPLAEKTGAAGVATDDVGVAPPPVPTVDVPVMICS